MKPFPPPGVSEKMHDWVPILTQWFRVLQRLSQGLFQPNGGAVFAVDNDDLGYILANNANFTPFGDDANFSGLFILNETTGGKVGVFTQGGAAISMIDSGGGTFTTVLGNPGTINVYLITNVIRVENQTGASVEIRAMALRTRNHV